MEKKTLTVIELSQLSDEQEKNNQFLLTCLKKVNLPQEEIQNILMLNNIQQVWKLLADYANDFNLFTFEEKKNIIKSFFSSEFYGKTISETYDLFSKFAETTSVGKELLKVYSYVNIVAEYASTGFPQKLSAIADALCKVLEENTLCNDKRELTVRLSSEEREEGFYAYNLDNYTLSFLGKNEKG